MKQTVVHLNNLKKAMELSKTNTVVFENCTNFEKYSSDKYNGTEGNLASKKLFSECGVDYYRFDSKKSFNVNLKSID